MAEQPSFLREVIIAVGALMTGLFGKPMFDWLTGRTRAETKHISTTSDVSLLEMTDKVAKDYIGLFRDATAELKAAGEEIRQIQRRHHNAAVLVRKMLDILKQANHESWEQLEREAKQILED